MTIRNGTWNRSSYSAMEANQCVEAALTWTQSGRSSFESACVEAAAIPGRVLLRDSRNPQHAPLAFPREEWWAFLHAARDGAL